MSMTQRRIPMRRKVVWRITGRLFRIRDWFFSQAARTVVRGRKKRPFCVWCSALRFLMLDAIGTGFAKLAKVIGTHAYSKAEYEADPQWQQWLQKKREKVGG